MNRRIFVAGLGAVLTAPRGAGAETARTVTIGVLNGDFPNSPCLDIVAGKPVVWKAVLPTGRRVGAPFRLCLKSEDRWGNPSPTGDEPLRLSPSLPISGLPEIVMFERK